MSFKDFIRKKKTEFKEDSRFREQERRVEQAAEREARLKYARERGTAREAARFRQYKKDLNRPRQQPSFGLNDFFTPVKLPKQKVLNYYDAVPRYSKTKRRR